MVRPMTYLVLLLLALQANGQTEDLQELILPAHFSPTSSVVFATSTPNLADLFYRGPTHELLHVKMNADGVIVSHENLGGHLESAPAATSPHEGALDIAYVQYGRGVIVRSFRNGVWGSKCLVGPRLDSAPALFSNSTSTSLFMTFRGRLLHFTKPTVRRKSWPLHEDVHMSAMGTPAIADSGRSGLSPQIFVRNSENKLMYRAVSGGPWATVPVPKYRSDVCAMYFIENILAIFGRNANYGISMSTKIGSWSTSRLTTATASDAPGCFFAFNDCSDMIITHEGSLYRKRFCS